MDAKRRLTNFLVWQESRDFCDDCLADEMSLPRGAIVELAAVVAATPLFLRDRWRCSRCRREATVTRALTGRASFVSAARTADARRA